MTFPLPPSEAAFMAELQRQLDARLVEPEPEPAVAPNQFRIPARAQLELDQLADDPGVIYETSEDFLASLEDEAA